MTDMTDTFSVAKIDNMRAVIENMSTRNQINVLRILNAHKEVTLNENKYGVHVNMTNLNAGVLHELNNFIQYVNLQDRTLDSIEQLKEEYGKLIRDNHHN